MFGVGAELSPGLFEIFGIKDKVFTDFTDGRFQFKIVSFSWVDVPSTIHIVESANHPLTIGLYEFMKYSSPRRMDNQNAVSAYRFFYQNIVRGHGFRLTLALMLCIL